MQIRNYYAFAELDRAGHLRRDAGFIAARLEDPASRFVPVWRTHNLVIADPAGPRALLVERRTLAVAPDPEAAVLLGIAGEAALFALDLSRHDQPLDLVGVPAPAEFTDLRRVGALIDKAEGSILAYARGMIWWHQRHRFCGICGSPTTSLDGGHVRRCADPACGAPHFPRTDPAVIMLVTKGDRALLGRQKSWPPGQYSTLAGFVEPGESLEDAVAREVFEETGVRIADVRYHSSQPWPFPSSIMLGFTAVAETETLDVDLDELEDARWFDRDFMLRHVEDETFRLPRRDSIARRLIEDWLGREA